MENIKDKPYREKEFKEQILEALESQESGLSLADVVVATGLPTEWVEYTLRNLLNDYPCRLRINEQNELIYFFDLSARKKNIWTKLGGFFKPSYPSPPRLSKNSLVNQTLGYVFGEHNRPKTQLFIEKVILNYIRHNHGRIVVAEIVQITGWSVFQAETQMARLLGQYNGEVEVTPEGVIVYLFDSLAQADQKSQEIVDSLKVWERAQPEKTLHANSEAQLHRLEKFNRYNLGFSSLATLLSGGLFLSQSWGLIGHALLLGSAFSFSYSAAFFAIPAVRNLFLHWENEKIRLRNVETFILKGIFNRIQSQIFPEKDLKKLLYDTKPTRFYSYWWNQMLSSTGYEFSLILTSTYQREQLLEKKALELEAEINVDEEGNLYYAFERLQREIQVIQKLRHS